MNPYYNYLQLFQASVKTNFAFFHKQSLKTNVVKSASEIKSARGTNRKKSGKSGKKWKKLGKNRLVKNIHFFHFFSIFHYKSRCPASLSFFPKKAAKKI